MPDDYDEPDFGPGTPLRPEDLLERTDDEPDDEDEPIGPDDYGLSPEERMGLRPTLRDMETIDRCRRDAVVWDEPILGDEPPF